MEIREKKQNKVVVAKKSIVSYMRELRSRVSEEKKDVDRFSEQVVSTDRRRGVLNGKYVDRLVVFLKGTG